MVPHSRHRMETAGPSFLCAFFLGSFLLLVTLSVCVVVVVVGFFVGDEIHFLSFPSFVTKKTTEGKPVRMSHVEGDDLSERYTRVMQEYSKIKAQNAVLKKAVLTVCAND